MIRSYHQSDKDKVLKIWLEAFIHAHNFVGKEVRESKLNIMRDTYLPSAETYVYEEQGIVKGFVSLYGIMLVGMSVSPQEQGTGIGQKLMEKTKQIRKNIKLTIYKDNKRSVEFFKRSGLNIEGEQIDHHTGYPEVLMMYNGL